VWCTVEVMQYCDIKCPIQLCHQIEYKHDDIKVVSEKEIVLFYYFIRTHLPL
jgi:hypothetical protein